MGAALATSMLRQKRSLVFRQCFLQPSEPVRWRKRTQLVEKMVEKHERDFTGAGELGQPGITAHHLGF